jgi:uncharacterized protein (DUF736 family)
VPRSPSRNAVRLLSSPAQAHSSRDKKSPARHLPLRCGRKRCGLIAPRPVDRHRGRDRRGPSTGKETIGTFVKTGDDFNGTVKTLTLNIKAKITVVGRESEKAPDYRVLVGQIACGAAWKKTSNAGREYLSVKLDDPSFAAPVFASLVAVEGSDSYALTWARRNGD